MTDLDIPKLVKEFRQRLGLTQEQFAQRVGVTYGSVNHWENGKRRPQPFLVRRLLEIALTSRTPLHSVGNNRRCLFGLSALVPVRIRPMQL